MNHITIDLDYFQNSTPKTANNFFKRVIGTGKPILAFLEHHHIIQYINNYRFGKIINIDYHDDVVENSDRGRLADYNWVNYYKYRKTATYEWRYPSYSNFTTTGFRRLARCTDTDVWKFELTGWKNTEHRRGLRNIDLDSVQNFSVVISPAYTIFSPVLDVCEKLFGTRNEEKIIDLLDNKWIQIQ